MAFELLKREVGPWPMNTYLVLDEAAQVCALIDPGADPETILGMAGEARIAAILITHGHADHVGALDAVRDASRAPVYLHPLDAERFGLDYDIPLEDGLSIPLGSGSLQAIHTPGHTPGMTSLRLDAERVVVGDTLFVGGPGRTWSAEEFAATMETMQAIVFQWQDGTHFYPGHGPSGQIGLERQAFEAFVARGWAPDLYGDVTWKEV